MDTNTALSDSQALINALRHARCFPHPVATLDIIETHTSWVILTGEHAYKIKKPVDLGFLDYTSLKKRRHACDEELRLNRILAPDLYIGVVPIAGSVTAPRVSGEGNAIEYAVHMHELDQNSQLDHLLERGELDRLDMDAVAREIATFHLGTAVVGPATPYGRPEEIKKPVLENFSVIIPLLAGKPLPEVDDLLTWSDAEYRLRRSYMQIRRDAGYVRECHGDLHLANLTKYRSEILAFDRIEFSESLRWIDVMNDSAFLVMDLLFHKRRDLAFRYLNGYLQITGDYRGLSVLRYYLAYRALVRAKVALLRINQEATPALRESATRTAKRYIELAGSIIQPTQPQLLLMHGFSGSGKTWISERLMTALPAIRLRSDVERKRLHGLTAHERSHPARGEMLYSAASSEWTYGKLANLAESVCLAGYSVIVDAAFLQKWQRRMFQELAGRLAIPWTIVECSAPAHILQERVQQRLTAGLDASEADTGVLQQQLEMAQPLDEQERKQSVCVETNVDVDTGTLTQRVHASLE